MKAIVDEIGKYLVPAAEADKLKAQEQNVKKLGQPLKSIKVGSQKILKYKDMTVTLKAGRVADVKVN